MKNLLLLCSAITIGLSACSLKNSCTETVDNDSIVLTNPILPNFYADPSIVELDGTYYLYVTTDPWGADSLACWESKDFKNWTLHTLNWPTKPDCTSAMSNENNVWAPSVIRRGDMYYMYISVGSEVWCGVAEHPLGPWKNALGEKPMIAFDPTRYYHVIDAEVFIDTDNRAYLYWGSGWEWINGHCFAAELNDDMASFKSVPVEVTPSNYFEAPFMIKNGDQYFLMYSDGKTIEDTYKVRYAVGDNPFGPFTEASNSPILQSDPSKQVFGPGHHCVFTLNNQHYILYHKHSLPFKMGTAMRQLCIDKMDFSSNGIETIVPTDSLKFPNLLK